MNAFQCLPSSSMPYKQANKRMNKTKAPILSVSWLTRIPLHKLPSGIQTLKLEMFCSERQTASVGGRESGQQRFSPLSAFCGPRGALLGSRPPDGGGLLTYNSCQLCDALSLNHSLQFRLFCLCLEASERRGPRASWVFELLSPTLFFSLV